VFKPQSHAPAPFLNLLYWLRYCKEFLFRIQARDCSEYTQVYLNSLQNLAGGILSFDGEQVLNTVPTTLPAYFLRGGILFADTRPMKSRKTG